jgi:hypothetical protein
MGRVRHFIRNRRYNHRDHQTYAVLSCTGQKEPIEEKSVTDNFDSVTCPTCARIEIGRLEKQIEKVRDNCGLHKAPGAPRSHGPVCVCDECM